MARLVHYIHNVARFFEVLNGGVLHPDYDLTLKPASGYMLRAYSTRTMEKRGAITREEVAFHTSFPDISNSEIFVPQRETGTEYNDISRETTITPAQCKAKVAAGEWFIYAEPKVSCDANGIYGLRVKRPPANKPATCRYCNGVLSRFQHPCNPIERLCTGRARVPSPLQSPRTPLHALSENPPIWVPQNQISQYAFLGVADLFLCGARFMQKKGAQNARRKFSDNPQMLFLDFPVERPALEGRIVLHLLDFFLRLAEIARRHITRGRLALLARFGAFDYNCFSGHCVPLLKI